MARVREDLGGPDPLEFVAQGRSRYARERGFSSPSVDYRSVVMPESATGRVAAAYGSLPTVDPEARPAWDAYRHDIRHQFEYLTSSQRLGGMGVSIEQSAADPYSGSKAMMQDLAENRRLKIFATGTDESGHHPVLSNEENDMFRAVHDVFGHASIGRGFDRHGEEAAYLSHASMFSPLGRQAMATETRGQNSYFITHGEFPVQKASILPAWARATVPILGRRGERRSALMQARHFNREQFG